MTFTVVARCPRTGRLGIGITTFSVAVGAMIHDVRANVGVVTVQANPNPPLGPLALNLLELGYPPQKVLKELAEADPLFEYRQVGVVDRLGNAAGFTGNKTTKWAGDVVGDGYVATGNVLAGEHVVRSMAEAFESATDKPLEERLLLALEAGRDAGGQSGATGEKITERSAALLVYGRDGTTLSDGWLDLRVDVHDTALDELRRIYEHYKPYPDYYRSRIAGPDKALRQDLWLEKMGIKLPLRK